MIRNRMSTSKMPSPSITVLMLLLSLQLLVHDVSSLQFQSITSSSSRTQPSRRWVAPPSSILASRRITAGKNYCLQPTTNNNRRLFTSKLFVTQSSSPTTSSTSLSSSYNVDDVVELQYSEFLPPSGESSHPPVM